MIKFTRKRSNTSDSNPFEKPPSPSFFLKQALTTQAIESSENENKNNGDQQSPVKINVSEKQSSKDSIQSTEWARQLLEMIPRDADGQQIDKRAHSITEQQQPRFQDSNKSFIPGHYPIDVSRMSSEGKYKTLDHRRTRFVGEGSRSLKFQVNAPNASSFSPPDLSKTEANVLKWREIEEERKKRRGIEEEKRIEFSKESNNNNNNNNTNNNNNNNNSNSSSQNISPQSTLSSHPLQNFERALSGGSLDVLENLEEENSVFLKRTGSAEIEYHRSNDSDVDFSGSEKEEDNNVHNTTPPQEKEEKGTVSVFNGGSGGKAKFMSLMRKKSLKSIAPISGEKSEKDKKDRFLPTIGLDGRLKKLSTRVKGVLNQGPVFPSLPGKLKRDKIKTGDQKDIDIEGETPANMADDLLILDEYTGSQHQQNERSGSPIHRSSTVGSDAREVTSSPSPTLRRRINRNINQQVAKQRKLTRRTQEINRLIASIASLSDDIRQTKHMEDSLQRKFDTFSFETSQNIHQFEEKVSVFKTDVAQYEKSNNLIDSQLKLIKPRVERASQLLNSTTDQIKSLETSVQAVQRSNRIATDSLLRFFSRFSLSVFGVFEGTANLLVNFTKNTPTNKNTDNTHNNNNDFLGTTSQQLDTQTETEELIDDRPHIKYDPNIFNSDYFCDLLNSMSTEKCAINLDDREFFPEDHTEYKDASQSFLDENDDDDDA